MALTIELKKEKKKKTEKKSSTKKMQLMSGYWIVAEILSAAPLHTPNQQAKIMLRDELLALVENQLPCHPAWANSETSKPPQVRPTVG